MMWRTGMDRLNVVGLMAHMGGRSRIPGALRDYGISRINVDAVDQIIHRKSISSTNLIDLMILAKCELRPIDLYDFVIWDFDKFLEFPLPEDDLGAFIPSINKKLSQEGYNGNK